MFWFGFFIYFTMLFQFHEYTKRRLWTLNWGRDVQGTGRGLLQILAQHLPGKMENNHKKVNMDRSSPDLQLNPWTLQYETIQVLGPIKRYYAPEKLNFTEYYSLQNNPMLHQHNDPNDISSPPPQITAYNLKKCGLPALVTFSCISYTDSKWPAFKLVFNSVNRTKSTGKRSGLYRDLLNQWSFVFWG